MPIGIASVVIGAAGLANNIYGEVNAPDGSAIYGRGQSLTPEQQLFYEKQALVAENAAAQDERAAIVTANNADATVNYAKFAAVAFAAYLLWKVFKKKL